MTDLLSRRTFCAALLPAAVAAGLAVTLAVPRRLAAQPGRVFRVGILSFGREPMEGFRRDAVPELARDGFVEGRNLEVVARASDGDPALLRAGAAEILAARPHVVVAITSFAARLLHDLDPAMPVVAFAGFDPVTDGLAQSLARPGGSVTGIVMQTDEVDRKLLELAREALPTARRLGFLAGPGVTAKRAATLRTFAAGLGVELVVAWAASPGDYAAAFAALRDGGAEAVVVQFFAAFNSNVADLALRAREASLPVLCGSRRAAAAGCLASLGPDLGALNHRLARIVARVLRGEPPSTIPMERADRYDVAFNLRAARALSIELPPLLIARAAEVID